MKPETLGGLAGGIILIYYLLWRISTFHAIFMSAGKIP